MCIRMLKSYFLDHRTKTLENIHNQIIVVKVKACVSSRYMEILFLFSINDSKSLKNSTDRGSVLWEWKFVGDHHLQVGIFEAKYSRCNLWKVIADLRCTEQIVQLQTLENQEQTILIISDFQCSSSVIAAIIAGLKYWKLPLVYCFLVFIDLDYFFNKLHSIIHSHASMFSMWKFVFFWTCNI